MAAKTLDDPPPITPARFRNWPYVTAPFPFAELRDDAGLLAVSRDKKLMPPADADTSDLVE